MQILAWALSSCVTGPQFFHLQSGDNKGIVRLLRVNAYKVFSAEPGKEYVSNVSNGDDDGDGDGEITPDPNRIGVRRGSARSFGTQEREDVVWRLDAQS